MIAKADKPYSLMEKAVERYINGMYIENIPKYSWYQALQDAGYTDSTAHDRCAEIWKRATPSIDKRMEEIREYMGYTLEWVDQQFKDLYADARNNSDRVNAARCLEGLTKRKAGFTEVIAKIGGDSDDQPKTEQELLALDAAATAYKRTMALTPVSGPDKENVA